MQRGQHHQALADLTEAVRLHESAEAVSNLGECYLQLGDYPRGLAAFTRASDLQPENGRWLLTCAAVRLRLEDVAGAGRDRDRAIRIDAKLADAPAIQLPAPLPPSKRDPE